MFDFLPDWEWLNFMKGAGPQPYDGLLGGTSTAPMMSPMPGMVAQASPMPVQNRPETLVEQMGIGQPSAADMLGVARPVPAAIPSEAAVSRSDTVDPTAMDPAAMARMGGLLAPVTRRGEETQPRFLPGAGLYRMQLGQMGMLPGAQMRRR